MHPVNSTFELFCFRKIYNFKKYMCCLSIINFVLAPLGKRLATAVKVVTEASVVKSAGGSATLPGGARCSVAVSL